MSTSSMRRVGLIGDVHAQDHKLAAALHFFAHAEVDAILCVGDVVDGRGDAERCCRLLREGAIPTVRGNHDRWFLKGEMRDLPHITPRAALSDASLAWLAALPTSLTFETTGGKLLLGHGVGKYDMARLTPDDYGYALESNSALQQVLHREWRFVIGGHTHRRMVRSIGHDVSGQTITMINPGSLIEGHDPCFAIADFGQGRVVFHDFIGDAVSMKGRALVF